MSTAILDCSKTAMVLENIVTETLYGNIKIVRYNKPKKKNALDVIMYRKITNILREVSNDDKIGIVVLTGTGDFYSSGNDMSNLSESLQHVLREFIRAFIEFPKMLIAIVNGPAIGIAATTLAFCDFVFASESSYFYTPFTKLGVVPEGCSTFTFSKLMGERKATDMLLFNYKMSAKEALRCGFVNDLYKPEELQHKVWNKIIEMNNLNHDALFASKKLLRVHYKEQLLQLNDDELNVVFKLNPFSKL